MAIISGCLPEDEGSNPSIVAVAVAQLVQQWIVVPPFASSSLVGHIISPLRLKARTACFQRANARFKSGRGDYTNVAQSVRALC